MPSATATAPSRTKDTKPFAKEGGGDPQFGGTRSTTEAGSVCRWHAYSLTLSTSAAS